MRGKLSFRQEHFILGVCSICLLMLLVLKPQISMKGVQNGLYICAGQIIPALFPFCVLACFLVNSEIIDAVGKIFSPFVSLAFKLPKKCSGAILMSFIGGYPVGAITLNELYERGEISKNQFRRMMIFCVNAGPAFVIGTVGNAILGSVRAGLLIFLSLTLSSITLGFLSRFTEDCDDERTEIKNKKEIMTLSDSIIKAVSTSNYTMQNVCAWIVIFSCILEFIVSTNLSQLLKDFLLALCEVTRGTAACRGYKNIPLTAFILGWSGISVQLQIFKYVKLSGLKTIHFICSRLISAALSCLYCFLILKLVPCPQDVFGSITSPTMETFSVSIPSALSMLIMGVSFILELDRNKIKC